MSHKITPITNDADYVEAGKAMRIFFALGGAATVAMFIMLIVDGISWFAIAEALVAAVSLVLGAHFETERTAYRFRKEIARAAAAGAD